MQKWLLAFFGIDSVGIFAKIALYRIEAEQENSALHFWCEYLNPYKGDFPMISLRQRSERGQTKIDWLNSYHTFSFGDYFDPQHMGFSDLRVINDDYVAPGKGFDTHGHQNMEIVTYVLEGVLAHKDSLGNGSLILPGEVQRMSAGTGIRHSEFNPSETEPVHLLQIWILPERQAITPSYEQKAFLPEEMQGRWRLVVSPDARDGSLTIHQSVEIYVARLGALEPLTYQPRPDRACWLHVASGVVQSNGRLLEAGDAMAIMDEPLSLEGVSRESEVMLFDLRKPAA
jgi:redox-sensitive bicupin YhaK (pirin superfamily)